MPTGSPAYTFLSYLTTAFSATVAQLFILFGPLLLLGYLLNTLARFIEREIVETIGLPIHNVLTLPGVVVHEQLGHVLFLRLSGRKITKVWFNPDPRSPLRGVVLSTPSQTLRHYVGDFFVGIGPLIMGTLILALTTWLLIGPVAFQTLSTSPLDNGVLTLAAAGRMINGIVSGIGVLFTLLFSGRYVAFWQVVLFLYLTFSIGSSMALSPPDYRTAVSGFQVLAATLLVFNLLTVWMGRFLEPFFSWLAQLYQGLYTAMAFALIATVVVAALLFPLWVLFKR